MPRKLECSNNRRRGAVRRSVGAVMVTAVSIAVASGVFIIALGTIRHHHKFHQAFLSVFHLKDGRFCYRQRNAARNGDSWFWLWDMRQKNYYRSKRPLTDRTPDDTVWVSSGGDSTSNVQSRLDPEEEEEIDEETSGKALGEQQEQVVENEADEPASVDEGGNSASSDESAGGSSSSDEGGGGGGGDEGGGGGGGDD
jgi:uncharacterized membrane protein YgcG